ncbi:MAG TPA: hypothetical protein DD412_08180 [Holosporales bacterium]|nr:hypothetical protein [Holosporales bacterium]
MKFQNKRSLPALFSFLVLLMWSNILFASRLIKLEVTNEEIDEATTLHIKFYNGKAGEKQEEASFELAAVSVQPETVHFYINSSKLSRIELSLFFEEDRHRTALFFAQDLKFIPLEKLSISLFSNRIDADVTYNLPPIWKPEDSSKK